MNASGKFVTFFVTALVASAFLISCQSASFPTEEQVMKDAVGQTFFYYYNWGSGGEKCTLKDGQLTSVNINKEETISDSSSGILTYIASISAKIDNALLVGEVEIHYKKYYQGWKIEYMKSVGEKQGSSFDMRMTNNKQE